MKKYIYKGEIKNIPKYKIYLNVNHLDSGKYTLNIVSNNKVITTTIFEK